MENGSCNVENGSVKWKMEIGNAKWHLSRHGTHARDNHSNVMIKIIRSAEAHTYKIIQLMQNPLLFSVGTLCCCQRRVYSRVTLWALCYSVSIHPMVLQLDRSSIIMFYLDDGSLGGSLSDVLFDLQLVEKLGSDLGLQLNQ